MIDLRRIQYVASHYQEIQGLRIVPLGLWLILVAASSLFPTDAPQIGFVVMLACLFSGFLVLVAYKLVGTFYERHYGSAHPPLDIRPRALSGCLSGAGYLFLVYIGIGRNQIVTEVALILSALLVYAAWRSEWYRKDYLVLAALLIAAANLSSGAAVMVLNGLVVIAGGLLDHMLLVGTLKHTPEQAHAGSI